MTNIHIIPTVVPEALQDIEEARTRYAFADRIHIDAADGSFAENKTWMPMPGDKLPDAKTIMYEVHLMVDQPLTCGVAFVHAGVRGVIGHIESFNHADGARDIFKMWRGAGAKEIGIAILIDTPIEELIPYASLCDFFHVMTIATIGEQGLPFDERSISRIEKIHARFPTVHISVDGGVSEKNISALRKAGAERFCIGSALQMAEEPHTEYQSLVLAGNESPV